MKLNLFVVFASLVLATTLGLGTTLQWRHLESPAQLPPSDLNVAEIIEILTDYSVIHQAKIVGGPYAGLIDVQTKEIFISDQYDQMYRRQTVIHELLHAYYLRKHNLATGGYSVGEEAVEAEATKIYERLFVPLRNITCGAECASTADFVIIGVQ